MSDNQNIKWKEQGARFAKLLDTLGLKQTIVAELVGSKQPTISHSLNGKIGVPERWIYRLSEKYSEINRDWVYTGDGEMFLSDKKDENIINDPGVLYGNAKELTRKELEKLVLHLSYRVTVLEEWKKDMEEWKREAISMVERGKKK